MKTYKSEPIIKFEMSDEQLVSQLYKFLTTIQEYEKDAACRNIARHTNVSYVNVLDIIS